MPNDVGVSIPYQDAHPRSSGRAFSDHTLEESDDAFLASLIVQFQGQWVTGQDAFFKVMPIVYYRGDGTMIKVKTFQIKAVAFDPRPLGVSAQSTVQSAQEYMVTMTRWGLRLKYNTDSIQSPEGLNAFKERLAQFKAAAINTMMSHGMAAINAAASDDPLSDMNLQFQKHELRNIQNLNTKFHRDLVGCMNNSTGALRRAITSFNQIFAYYSGMTRHILMCPETYAMLQNRPWAPDVPEFAVESITRSRKVATGGGCAPSGHPDVDCIIIPQLPRDSAGKMYNPLQRRVYASTYMYFESPVPSPETPFKQTSLAAYDIDLDSQTTLSARSILNADPMLQSAPADNEFAHRTFDTRNAMLGPLWFILNTPANDPDGSKNAYPKFDEFLGTREKVEQLCNAFKGYALTQTWGLQFQELPANASPWGISIETIYSWKHSPFRRALMSATNMEAIPGDAINKDVYTIHNAVHKFILKKEDVRFDGAASGSLFGADKGFEPDELYFFGVAIMWLEVLCALKTGHSAIFKSHENEFAQLRSPHFLFLRKATQDACFARLRAEPYAASMKANWNDQGQFVRAFSLSPYITVPDFLRTVGGKFDNMINIFKAMSWSPVAYVVIKPANVALGFRMVFVTGPIGQIFVRLDGTFEGLDVGSNMADIETAMHVGALVTRRQEVCYLDNGHLKLDGPTIAFRLEENASTTKKFAQKLRGLINRSTAQNTKHVATLLPVPVCGHATGENKLEVQFYKEITTVVNEVKKKNETDITYSHENQCTHNISLYLAYSGFKASHGSKGAVGTCATLDEYIDEHDRDGLETGTQCVTRFRDPETGEYHFYLEPSSHFIKMGSTEVSFREGNSCIGVIKDRISAYDRSGNLGSGGGEVASTIQRIRTQ